MAVFSLQANNPSSPSYSVNEYEIIQCNCFSVETDVSVFKVYKMSYFM